MEKINFREYNNEDLKTFYSLFSKYENAAMVYPHFHIKSFSEFENWFCSQFRTWHDFFTITDGTNNIIGYVYTYQFRELAGTCKVCIDLLPAYRYSGIGAVCSIKFISYLFNVYPMRKLYAEVYSYNKKSVSLCRKMGAIEEGCLKEYRYYNSKFEDQYIFALNKAQAEELCIKWKSLL